MNNKGIKPRVLFLCTGNSCRSQMAEGIARRFYGDRVDIESAGIEKHGMNPHAIKVMAEAGIDIESHSSKTLEETGLEFDCIVTVCDHAKESGPEFSDKIQVCHFPFPDPPKLALDARSEEGKLDCYRKVRNQIQERMSEIIEAIS